MSQSDYLGFLNNISLESFEERMLQGMVISQMPEPLDIHLAYIRGFIPHMDNWSVCDSFCVGIQRAKQHKHEFWEFTKPYFAKDEEFSVRFASVMFLSHFIVEEYLDEAFYLIREMECKAYYAQMAAAWALSICYTQYPEKTMAYLENAPPDDFICRKALQKIVESRKVSEIQKEEIRDRIQRNAKKIFQT